MKTMRTLAAGLLLLVCPLMLVAQKECPTPTGENTGQQIILKKGRLPLGVGGENGLTSLVAIPAQNDPAFTFELSDPKKTVPNNNCKDTTCHECGWYKAFWILGDGNYKKFEDDIAHMDAASHTASYVYAKRQQQATYVPVMYLTERYHNDKKPGSARIAIPINSSATLTTVADSPVLLNATSKRAAMDYNHEMRNKYPTTFVLSHLNNDEVTRVLFYYNSLDNDGVRTPQHVMDYDKTEVPAYFDPRVADRAPYDLSNSTDPYFAKFGSNFFSRLSQKFGTCKEYSYDFDMNTDLTAGRNEIRLFPVMNTVAFGEGKIPEQPAFFASVVLGRKPLVGDSLASVRAVVDALFAADNGVDIGNDLQVSIGGNNQGGQEYIRGVATQSLAILASHDPNNLFVTKIDTLENGRFKVSFSMRICNEGQMPELSPDLIFTDLTGGHYAGQPLLIGMPAGVTVSSRQDFDGYHFNLNGFLIRGVPLDYEPRCEFVHFSMETDQVGVQKLYQDSPRVLKVCVKFSGSTGELDCSENDVLKPEDLRDTPVKDVKNNDCWLLFFLAFLVLTLIIYAWKNNQDNS